MEFAHLNSRLVDITGRKFSYLTVVSFSHVADDKLARWNCICDCGKTIIAKGSALRKGNTKSCGCLRNKKSSERKYVNMTGRRFGNIIVVRDVGRAKTGKVLWECRCDCGNVFNAPAGDIRKGGYVSCGCAKWTGEKNPRWRGGNCRTAGFYPPEWNKKLRNKIRKLDNYECRFPQCDKPNNGRNLDVHHIDGNKYNCDEYNLVSLCNHHHQYVESHNPREWESYFCTITGRRHG